jgi:hypothetical protein
MSATVSAPEGARESRGSAGGLGSALNSVLSAAASRLERRVAGWIHKLDDVAADSTGGNGPAKLVDKGLDAVAESGNTAVAVGAEGVKASLHGQSPLWAAIKEAWHSGTPITKALIVTAAVSAVLLLVLAPVVLLVFLISWLIIAAARRAGRPRKPDSEAE